MKRELPLVAYMMAMHGLRPVNLVHRKGLFDDLGVQA